MKKVGNTTRLFRYDLNQIPHYYTVEVTKRFKGLYLVDRVPEEIWTEVCDIVQKAEIKTIPKKKKCNKAKWLSEEALQIAEKRREVKHKGDKERYTHFIYLFFLPVRLPSEIQKLPPDPPVRGFPGVWKLPLLRLPSQDRSPSLTLLSLFFIFYILSYILLKTMGCFSGCLMSSASNQKLFCGVCSAFNCSFDEFVGERVVSPSYSSQIYPFECKVPKNSKER